jgi:hypothetical protein
MLLSSSSSSRGEPPSAASSPGAVDAVAAGMGLYHLRLRLRRSRTERKAPNEGVLEGPRRQASHHQPTGGKGMSYIHVPSQSTTVLLHCKNGFTPTFYVRVEDEWLLLTFVVV